MAKSLAVGIVGPDARRGSGDLYVAPFRGNVLLTIYVQGLPIMVVLSRDSAGRLVEAIKSHEAVDGLTASIRNRETEEHYPATLSVARSPAMLILGFASRALELDFSALLTPENTALLVQRTRDILDPPPVEGSADLAIYCTQRGATQRVSISFSALRRMRHRIAPIPPCPTCGEDCEPRFHPYEIRPDETVFVHCDDSGGGRWAPGEVVESFPGGPLLHWVPPTAPRG